MSPSDGWLQLPCQWMPPKFFEPLDIDKIALILNIKIEIYTSYYQTFVHPRSLSEPSVNTLRSVIESLSNRKFAKKQDKIYFHIPETGAPPN